MGTPGPATRASRRLLVGVVGLAVATLAVAACAGRPGGNDTPKRPGEQNPARNGPPYEH